MGLKKSSRLYCRIIHSRRLGVPSLKINQVRVGVETPETLRDGTNALFRQLLAMAASAQLVMTTSSNGLLATGVAHTAQGPARITGRDVRVTDVAHPRHRAEVIRTVQVKVEPRPASQVVI